MHIEGNRGFSSQKLTIGIEQYQINWHRTALYTERGKRNSDTKIFKFHRLRRGEYIKSALKVAFSYSFNAWRLCNFFKMSGENPSFNKIINSVEVSNSSHLKVGIHIKNDS